MWSITLFLIVIFRVDALLNLHQAPNQNISAPQSAAEVPLSSSADWKKAREEAVVKPFAGNVKSYSGFFDLSGKYYIANMFFWFFPSEKESTKVPLILWLHGGPADSAMMGLFEENGPYKIVDGKATLRETSWTKHYNVLYLDSPAGVGFSYTNRSDGYSLRIDLVVVDIYNALSQFYRMFPEYEKNAFYVAGQSYGGKYIPGLASLIHDRNEMTEHKINLKGVMIGGSCLDPPNQIAFGQYLYEYGVVDRRYRDEAMNNDDRAKCLLDSGHADLAIRLLRLTNNKMISSGYSTCLDISDPHLNMTSIYNATEAFVTRDDVRKQIHAGNGEFRNRKSVLWYLHWDFHVSAAIELSKTVQLGYQVLLYSGQYDMATPPEQMDKVIESLDWNGLQQFHKANVQLWYSHGELAGYKKSHANLHQVLVRKANHMIVRSQPKWMLELLKSFAV